VSVDAYPPILPLGGDHSKTVEWINAWLEGISPGPWLVDDLGVCNGAGLCHVEVFSEFSDDGAEGRNDAAFIAAAPTLLLHAREVIESLLSLQKALR